jgi:tetrahydromethanopterin S-methyltransferase subunit G
MDEKMMKVLIRKEKIKELKNREKEVDKDVSIE